MLRHTRLPPGPIAAPTGWREESSQFNNHFHGADRGTPRSGRGKDEASTRTCGDHRSGLRDQLVRRHRSGTFTTAQAASYSACVSTNGSGNDLPDRRARRRLGIDHAPG